MTTPLELPTNIAPQRAVPSAIQPALADFQARVQAIFPQEISAMILYGSHARGEARPESDIDLMVVVPWRDLQQADQYYFGGASDPRWQTLVDAAIDTLIEYGRYISVLVVGERLFRSSWEVATAAKSEGIVLWPKPLT